LKTTNVTLASNYHSWWSCPLTCLCLVWFMFDTLYVTLCRHL
jgi:hypothetical protein